MKAKYDLVKLSGQMALNWYSEPPGASPAVGSYAPWVEATIHELAHAAVFGWVSSPPREIGDYVENKYRKYTSDIASDLSEMRTLAVECIVVEALGLDNKIRLKLVVECAQLKAKWPMHRRRELVEKFQKQPINQRRAKTVIQWIDRAMGFHVITDV